MKPDKKYMSESSSGNLDIHFIPPTFSSDFRQDFLPDQNPNEFLDLYPSETESQFLYCYYSSFGNCNNTNVNTSSSNNNPNNVTINNNARIPMPSEVLMNFDLDLDEDIDLERNCCENNIDSIYDSIVKNNPGIFSALSTYRIPSPIAKIIIRRVIKLTLSYCEKDGD